MTPMPATAGTGPGARQKMAKNPTGAPSQASAAGPGRRGQSRAASPATTPTTTMNIAHAATPADYPARLAGGPHALAPGRPLREAARAAARRAAPRRPHAGQA